MKAQRPRSGGAILGMLITLCVALPFLTSALPQLRYLSYELAFALRPETSVSDVLILEMDDESHQYLRQPTNAAWDRAMHAAVIERLHQWKARAIAFDINFNGTTTPEADSALVRAATQANTVFGIRIEAPAANHIVWQKPFTDAVSWGVAEIATGDKVIREHYRDPTGEYHSLAYAALAATGTNVPTPNQQRWLNYYGPPGTLPRASFYQVFSNTTDVAAAVSNKVVFVGARVGTGYTGGTGRDFFRTPYTRWTGQWTPGVEAVATAYLNLARRDWLTELGWGYEFLLALASAIFLGAGFSRLSPLPAVIVAAILGVIIAFAGTWSVWRTLLWTPWMIPVAIQIPAALGWSVLMHTRRLQREKEDLRLELLAARLQQPTPGTEAITTAAPHANTIRNANSSAPQIPDHTMLRRIGKGAFGEVWAARNAIGTHHAVKVIYRGDFPDESPFDREFRGIRKFTPISRSHPGFVNILHVGRNDEAGYFYYIMELGDDQHTGQIFDVENYSARTLRQEIDRRGRLPISECLDMTVRLSSALHHLHQHQLIHRDIKPANIIFVNNFPKLADIGLVTDIAGTSGEVSCLGTEGYIAPERPGTPTADVYSFGKVLYEITTGLHRSKFPELPTELLASNVNAPVMMRLNRIILKACEEDPRKRYQSAAELHDELLDLQRHLASPGQLHPR